MRPIRFIPDDTSYRFMWYARFFYALSGLLMIASVVLFATKGLNFGIDFKGGTVIEIQTKGPADLASIRSTLGALALGEVEIQGLGSPDQVMIRVGTQPGEEGQQETLNRIRQALGPDVTYLRTEIVGPKVSAELAQTGTMAVLISMVGILIYIWFRFEWQFAIGAIMSTINDICLTLGFLVVTQIQVDLTTVAALLTIVGYSLNDTVVIYDRVRENLRRFKKMPLGQLLDLSDNEMLARTVMTSVTTLLALVALYLFGGEVIRSFVASMIFGIVIGTLSSIFISAPALIFFNLRSTKGPAISEDEIRAGEAKDLKTISKEVSAT